jgi:hypothetical protein
LSLSYYSPQEPDIGRVEPVINGIWFVLYMLFLLVFVPRRYLISSYRFYNDRVDYEAVTAFSMVGRSIDYARIIETGCVKGVMQFKRGMGNIILKVAAAGSNPGAQNMVLLDNLVLADIENIDENLEKQGE